MFKEKYSKAMDNISPDASIKREILSKLDSPTYKKHINPAVPWRIGFALCACFAIVLCSVILPKNNTDITTQDINRAYLTPVNNYDDVYKAFKKIKKETQHDDEYYELYVEEETAVDDIDGAAITPTTGTNDINTNNIPSLQNKLENTEESEDYSNTTAQVEGVDEADIVKTDGKYIYYLCDGFLKIIKAEGSRSRLINTLTLPQKNNIEYRDMYIYKNRLAIISTDYLTAKCHTNITIYNIENPEKLEIIGKCTQTGEYYSSRSIGDNIYLITNYYIELENLRKNNPQTYIPYTECSDNRELMPADSIMNYECDIQSSSYLVVCSFNTSNATLVSECSILGGADNAYCNTEFLLTARTGYEYKENYGGNFSMISAFALDNGKIVYKTSSEIPGYIDDQFSMDEYNGFFRFVTTVNSYETNVDSKDNREYYIHRMNQCVQLSILDKDLKMVGKIENLAKDEKIYSARFMGDIAYFVTFRQTDPLFSADLSDPYNPKIIGELKIPGFSEFLFPYGEGRLLGLGNDADENSGRLKGLKLSFFDINDPSNVTETNKTVLNQISYSPALSNHKAALISDKKNLIGFCGIESQMYSTKENCVYYLYSIENNGFEQKLQLEIESDRYDQWFTAERTRAIYINDYIYIISPCNTAVISINTLGNITNINY